MDARISVLERIAEDNRETFRGIKDDLRDISKSQTELKTTVAALPTRTALWGMVATVIATAIAIVGFFVGILTYLR